jgi:hypothetical protein
LWHVSSDVPEDASLSDHLAWAVTVKRSLPQPLPDDAGADVFVGALLEGSQGSFEISAVDAASLASAGLAVVFDVYGGEERPEEGDN